MSAHPKTERSRVLITSSGAPVHARRTADRYYRPSRVAPTLSGGASAPAGARPSTLRLARRIGFDRTTLWRWLRGQSQPRLPDFLCFLEATSLRLLDFVALFADPAKLDSTGPPICSSNGSAYPPSCPGATPRFCRAELVV
jgi:hypothetical protein